MYVSWHKKWLIINDWWLMIECFVTKKRKEWALKAEKDVYKWYYSF